MAKFSTPPSVDQFRQIGRVAAVARRCIVNAGYTFDQESILKAGDLLDAPIKEVEASEMVESFAEITVEERDAAHLLLSAAAAALKPFKCEPDLRRFQPKTFRPVQHEQGRPVFSARSRNPGQIANPLFLGRCARSIEGRERQPSAPDSHLCLNLDNPLSSRLAGIQTKLLLRRAVEMFYVQALLLGHQPLCNVSKEMTLLNEGLLALIEMGVAVGEDN